MKKLLFSFSLTLLIFSSIISSTPTYAASNDSFKNTSASSTIFYLDPVWP